MITSTHNPKIQWVRGLQAHARQRRDDSVFVVEGVRLVEEAFAAGWQPQLVLYTADLSARGQQLLHSPALGEAAVEEVTPAVLKAASDTETPQGILAVLPIPRPETQPLPAQPSFVLVPDGVRDPGNLGTLLRTASAAGVEAVLLPPGTADPYAPKVVRAGMGAHFRIPVRSLSWEEIRTYLGVEAGRMQVYLADSDGGLPYTQARLDQPLALVVGGEAEGAGPEALALATGRLHIPMKRQVESLNAAVAAAVLMFEISRQKSAGPEKKLPENQER